MRILGRHLNVCQFMKLKSAIINYLKVHKFNGFKSAFQIFIGNPTKNDNKNIYDLIPVDDIIQIRKLIRSSGTYLIVHSNYFTQLARQPEQNRLMISNVVKEMISAMALGAKGIVVHCGSGTSVNYAKPKKQTALLNIANNYVKILQQFALRLLKNWKGNGQDLGSALKKNRVSVPRLLLEISAGGGWEVGHKLKDFTIIVPEIRRLMSLLSPEIKSIVSSLFGICIDTCHLFASGVDVRSAKETSTYLKEMNKITGNLGSICLFHFNDAGYQLGSHHDVHETIGCGHIGAKDKEGKFDGLIEICKFAKRGSIPVVLETAERECLTLDSRNDSEIKSDNSAELKELKFVTGLFDGKIGTIDFC